MTIPPEYLLEYLCNTLVEKGEMPNIEEIRWMKTDEDPQKAIIVIREPKDEYSFLIITVYKGEVTAA